MPEVTASEVTSSEVTSSEVTASGVTGTPDRLRGRRGMLVLAALVLLLAGLGFVFHDALGAHWDSFIAWIFLKQKEFHRTLTGAMGTLSEEKSAAAAWLLVLFSFLYGVFHAAGPGHGKAIVTTYLLTHRDRIRRGLMLGVASSFFQGLVAVVLVYGLIYLAGWLPRETSQAVDWSERISFGLVGLMGAFLAWRAVRRIHARLRPAARDHHHHEHDHHDHDHDGACCGHAHGPSVEQIEQASDLKTAIGIILSVGLRPCTGAVIVLVLAKALGMALAGIGAVFAMSLGTAVTVSSLAFAAVHLRNWVGGRFGDRGTGWHIAGDMVGLVGGGVLLAMGGSLLAASFAPAHPLGI